jgi:hypothetical protein
MNIYETLVKSCDAEVPVETQAHANAATYDLYYGPIGVDYWREEEGVDRNYSFTASCKAVSDWFEAQDWPQYCDEDGEPLAEGDRQNFEDEGIHYYEVDLSDLRKHLFGTELSKYL